MERRLRLDPERLGFYPRRFLDQVSVPPRAEGSCSAAFASAERLRSRGPATGEIREFLDDLLAMNERWGASPAAIAAGEAVREGLGFVVVTGQQPALLGGPLLTLYKVATALSLARAAAATLGAPVATLFWNAADDVDLGEVASATLPDVRLSMQRLSLGERALPPRTMVGAVGVGEMSAALDAVPRIAAGSPGEAGAISALAGARGAARDLGEFAAALLLRLFPGEPLLVLDARSRPLRRAGAGLFRGYAARREEVARAVAARGDAVEAAGGRRAIDAEAARLCLFATPGQEREKLAEHEAVAIMGRWVTESPESLSPNVVLRPVLQESVLPSLGMVAGPGETAYLAEIDPVFDLLGVARPCVWPRLLATVLPEDAIRLAEKAGLGVEEVVADADAARRAARPALGPARFEEAHSGLAEAMARGFAEMEEAASAVDRGLPQFIDAARHKVEVQMERIRDAVMARVAGRAEAEMPAVKGLRDFVTPRGRPQERGMSLLAMPLLLGGAWSERLREAAEEHRQDLARGTAAHHAFVLAGGPASASRARRDAAHGS
jgi:bacillithiol biosynthesis cysteine-adding enzyme BshC